jgi:hypothetical protein
MRVEEQIAHKVDPELWRALTEATGDEILRTVMVLGNGANLATETPSIDPSSFANRMDYQRALRSQQQERVSGAVRPVQKQLEQLDLKTHGGEFSRSVVVEGTAQKILASLQLPGVQHASLDRTLTLDPSAALT